MSGSGHSNLMFDLKPGDSMLLGGVVCVSLVHKSGRAARLMVTAPREVTIEKNIQPQPKTAQVFVASMANSPRS